MILTVNDAYGALSRVHQRGEAATRSAFLTKITTSPGKVLRIFLNLLGRQVFPAAPWEQNLILFIGAVKGNGDMHDWSS